MPCSAELSMKPEKCVYETLCLQLVPHFQDVKMSEKLKVQLATTVTKINLKSISQPHAYLQCMVTISIKFQKYRY